MRKTLIAGIALAIGLTAGAVGLTSTVGADEGPKKVWICHFEDHEAGETWSPFHLDGDYVVAYREGMPLADQVTYCETGNSGASVPGELLLVSVNAVDHDDARGHRVQLTNRISGYPEGYKG